ncbi:MAG: hypothetical protein H7Y12_14345, partial [Sphingobacteriaceae bacterium]|nr:hypothetical protein [Cytophagaceae bacterium]
MRKHLSVQVFFLLLAVTAHAQILTPATWTVKPAKSSVKVGETVDILFSVRINPGW